MRGLEILLIVFKCTSFPEFFFLGQLAWMFLNRDMVLCREEEKRVAKVLKFLVR